MNEHSTLQSKYEIRPSSDLYRNPNQIVVS